MENISALYIVTSICNVYPATNIHAILPANSHK